MNYDNYYKKGGMTQEDLVSSIALRIGARKPAVAEFVEKNKIDADALNSDLKSGKVYFMDVITAIAGKPDNKYQKEIIKKYGSKMAHGGKTQGYDDREDERLAMKYGKIHDKDFVGSHEMREHSRRDDARFEERMARGGYVSKGELVWKKLTSSEKMKFLHENFTPEITPRSQETLVGKDYNFLPKNVKIVLESKYANVENYAKGGITREGEELTHYSPYFEKNVMVARINEDEKIVRPSHGYFYPNKIGKKTILWAKKNGYKFIQDGKEYAKGGYMADGGETERDKNGMLYALTEHVSSGEIANITNTSKYSDIDEIRSKAIKYYMDNGDKPYSYAELESVLKKVNHTKYGKGGYTGWDMRDGEVTLNGKLVTRYDFDSDADAFFIDSVTGSGQKGFGQKEQVYEYLTENLNLSKFEEGGSIENQYEGKSAEDVWESWNRVQRLHFLTDHKQHPYYNRGNEKFVVTVDDRRKYMNMSYDELPKMVRFMISDHVEEGQYAKGGDIGSIGNYRVTPMKRRKMEKSPDIVETDFSKSFSINGSLSEANEKAQEFVIKNNETHPTATVTKLHPSGNPLKNKIITYITKDEILKYAKGGDIDDYLPAQNKLNKKVLKEINKADINTKLEMGQVVVSALTDANFHSETRKFISIVANKPEWAKDPKLDYSLPFEKFKEAESKTVYASEYYDAPDEIEQAGRNIAGDSDWGFEPIVESLKYASHMKGLHTIADALDKLNVSDNPKNDWKYTDVDEIEYVIVKDKNGKELRFAGKYVLSGVHDLLAKGGKLSDEGKYYSKNNVVAVVSGGKNIIDKNTVSGVWIMKNAKPMDEDVLGMKIGKTTIKKGHYGWVGKTMIDNFKGYDWDITTIKNSNGDLVTTAQGGKNKKEDGYSSFSFMMFQDPNIRLKSSRPARVTDKVVTEQHEQAIQYFKDNADLISEHVDKIQAKKKMADGGAIGFDALAKKVAKNYEGDKVKKEYQNQYGKTYDKEEAEEVGKKVAAKVYRQQQAKMKKGGKVRRKNPTSSNNKMTRIAKKASEIRMANESWRDAYNRAKSMVD